MLAVAAGRRFSPDAVRSNGAAATPAPEELPALAVRIRVPTSVSTPPKLFICHGDGVMTLLVLGERKDG